MTYRELFQRVQQTVAVLAGGTTEEADIDFTGAQTTRVRYAVKKNRDRLQTEVETFQELLAEEAEGLEANVERLSEIADQVVSPDPIDMEEDPTEQEMQAVDGVLDTPTGFEGYHVTKEAIMQEPSVPIPILDLADWMIKDE